MSTSVLCEIIGILILTVIFLQDIKHRAVSWILFPLLGAAYVTRFLYEGRDLIYPIFNYTFLIIQVAVVSLYVFLKYKSTKLFKDYLGLGDILYWVAIAWFFSPLNFIVYHVLGLVFALLIYIAFLRVEKKTIPLAGLQSLLLIVFTIVSWLTPYYETYNDNFILMLLG